MRAIDERELCEFARFEAPHSVTFVKDLPKLRPTFISLLFANLNQDRTYAGTLRPFAMRALISRSGITALIGTESLPVRSKSKSASKSDR